MEIIKEKHKVYIEDENKNLLAYCSFPLTGDNVVTIDHTVVDPLLRGQGIAKKLLESAYEVIKEQGYKVIPVCSYAKKWFNENTEKRDILK